ncbi:MAG: TrmB family transcriptional regulator [Halobacteriales archaeon]|nr:TrmB family transcriptional regulator [Halobacteriales archaeon]
MPIEREEFETAPDERMSVGTDTNADAVLTFLSDNADKAYTLDEIHDTTGVKKGSLGTVLSRLRERGLVKHRGKYWTIEDDDRLASAASAELAESAVLEEDEFDKEEWLEHAPDDE